MRPDSQCARVLRVLADGKPHTVPEIHRRAGTMRLNSRVAELREKGATIECERVPGRKGPGAYRYRLTAMSGRLVSDLSDNAVEILRVWTDDEPSGNGYALDSEAFAPRDERNRYRLYRLVADDLQLVATCATPEAVGVALVTLGSEGEFERSCVGLLDALAEEGERKWKLNPWDGDARW